MTATFGAAANALDANDGMIDSANGVEADLGIADHVVADDGNHLVLGAPPERACADERQLALTHNRAVVANGTVHR